MAALVGELPVLAAALEYSEGSGSATLRSPTSRSANWSLNESGPKFAHGRLTSTLSFPDAEPHYALKSLPTLMEQEMRSTTPSPSPSSNPHIQPGPPEYFLHLYRSTANSDGMIGADAPYFADSVIGYLDMSSAGPAMMITSGGLEI
ncbi:unnamed protein product [Schistocephalus solidus]|uniref:Uncharacterized protein n=1 Tax=Schistocephalus solidus TaxID=70667 RepID=A0A183T3X2_SCHSO|nr:unnamed protein product [Schistocephalus solidus]